MDLPVFVAGKASVEEARKALEEGVAYYLAHLEVEERPFPRPGATPPPDLEEERDRLIPVEIRPSPVNPVSLAIEKALRRKGLKRKDLAERMGLLKLIPGRLGRMIPLLPPLLQRCQRGAQQTCLVAQRLCSTFATWCKATEMKLLQC